MDFFRKPLNSESLQKEFPEMYREFFMNNEIVLGTPLDVSLLHDNNTRFRGVAVKQKIPLRVYCGISRNKQQQFGQIRVFDCTMNKFVLSPIEKIFPGFKEAINKLEKGVKNSDESYRIEILAEASSGLGFGVSSKIATLISMLFLLKYQSHALGDFHNVRDKDLHFDSATQEKILGMAADFLYVLREGDVDPVGISSSFISSRFPHYCILGQPIEEMEDFRNVPLPQPGYGKMEDLFHLKGTNQFFDYYYIHASNTSPIYRYDMEYKSDQEVFDEPLLIIPALLGRTLQELSLSDSSYLETLNVLYNLSFSFFTQFGQFLAHPLSNKFLTRSLRTLNHYANNIEYLEEENNQNLVVADNLRSILKQKKLKNFCVIRNGSYKIGGNMAIITERDKNRQLVFDAIQELKLIYPYLYVSYLSFIDGYASEGTTIEKYVEKNIRSCFDSPNAMIVDDWDHTKHYLHSIEKAEELGYDLLLDEIQHKIFIDGQAIHSKNLHSQRMTIDILRILLSRLNQEVSNADLPVSSYSQSKNEIQGKIIIPLKKLILDRTGKKIDLTCKGSNTIFYLKLAKNDLKIGYMYS